MNHRTNTDDKPTNKKPFSALLIFTSCILLSFTCLGAEKDKAKSPAYHQREDSIAETRELVYLQTDKGIYETGEDLWFKTYTMDAQSLALSDKSKTLFVEVFDAKDSIVWQEKYPVRSGIAEGHIYIDKNLAEGDYRVYATPDALSSTTPCARSIPRKYES